MRSAFPADAHEMRSFLSNYLTIQLIWGDNLQAFTFRGLMRVLHVLAAGRASGPRSRIPVNTHSLQAQAVK